MSNILKYFVLLILLSNCSLDTKSGIWTEKKDIEIVKIKKENVTQLFIKDKILTLTNGKAQSEHGWAR